MITISFPYNTRNAEDSAEIAALIKAQGAVLRSAYKLARFEGEGQKEIRNTFKASRTFNERMDSWFIQSAIINAIGKVDAEIALAKWKQTNIIPMPVFGGKVAFKKLQEGKITKAEFDKSRNANLYLIGEAPAKGNRKFIFTANTITFKPYAGRKIPICIPTPRGPHGRLWLALMKSQENIARAITVTLSYDRIHLSFDEIGLDVKKIRQPRKKRNRMAAIDVNPNFIGLVTLGKHGKSRNRIFNLSALTGKNISAAKLKHETREIGHEIGRYLSHQGIAVCAVEELKFTPGNKGIGRNFNRLCNNQFLHKELFRIIAKYVEVRKINAAYSSTIGNVLNPQLPDPLAAAHEMLRRGLTSTKGGRKSNPSWKWEFPPMVSMEDIQNRWKKDEYPQIETWVDLHQWIKSAKLKYRGDGHKELSYRIFKSASSQVTDVVVNNV